MTSLLSTQGSMQGLSRPIPHCGAMNADHDNGVSFDHAVFRTWVTTSWVPGFGAVVYCIALHCIPTHAYAITHICIAFAHTSAQHLHTHAYTYALHLHMHTLHLHWRAKPRRGERSQVRHVCSFSKFVHKQPCFQQLGVSQSVANSPLKLQNISSCTCSSHGHLQQFVSV